MNNSTSRSLREQILSARPHVQLVEVESFDFAPLFVRRASLQDRIGIQESFDRAKEGSRSEKQLAMLRIAATFLCDEQGDRPFDVESPEDLGILAERLPAHVVDKLIEVGLEFNGMTKKKDTDQGKVPSEPTPNSA
jgi:hypothetical protein